MSSIRTMLSPDAVGEVFKSLLPGVIVTPSAATFLTTTVEAALAPTMMFAYMTDQTVLDDHYERFLTHYSRYIEQSMTPILFWKLTRSIFLDWEQQTSILLVPETNTVRMPIEAQFEWRQFAFELFLRDYFGLPASELSGLPIFPREDELLTFVTTRRPISSGIIAAHHNHLSLIRVFDHGYPDIASSLRKWFIRRTCVWLYQGRRFEFDKRYPKAELIKKLPEFVMSALKDLRAEVLSADTSCSQWVTSDKTLKPFSEFAATFTTWDDYFPIVEATLPRYSQRYERIVESSQRALVFYLTVRDQAPTLEQLKSFAALEFVLSLPLTLLLGKDSQVPTALQTNKSDPTRKRVLEGGEAEADDNGFQDIEGGGRGNGSSSQIPNSKPAKSIRRKVVRGPSGSSSSSNSGGATIRGAGAGIAA